MAKAFCRRCKGTAEGSSFTEAAAKINHAVGLGRGLPCGANYGKTVDVSPKTIPTPEPKKTTKDKDPKKTDEKKDEVKSKTSEKKKETQTKSE